MNNTDEDNERVIYAEDGTTSQVNKSINALNIKCYFQLKYSN